MEKTKVIIDTDMGPAAAVAVLAALLDEEVEVLAIGLCHGTVELEAAKENLAALLALSNRGDIPVAIGAPSLEGGPVQVTPQALYLNRGFENLRVDAPPLAPSDQSAPALYRKVLEAEESVSILALGPLTNIAALLKQAPACKGHIKQLVYCGGSFARGGPTPMADVNTYLDAPAATACMEAGLPFVLCPQDLGNQARVNQSKTPTFAITCFSRPEELAQITGEEIVGLAKQGGDLARQFSRLLKSQWNQVNWQEEPGCRENPLAIRPLAALLICKDRSLARTGSYYCKVELSSQNLYGMTMIDIHGLYQMDARNPAYGKQNIILVEGVSRQALLEELKKVVR